MDLAIQHYLKGLNEGNRRNSLNALMHFFSYCGVEPCEAVEWQRNNAGRYRFVDLAYDWLRDQTLCVNTKKTRFFCIRGFFLANRAPLPKDKHRFKSEVLPVRREMTVDDFRKILMAAIKLDYRCAFLMSFQAGLGAEEIMYVNLHLADYVFDQVKKGSEIICLDLPGRKSRKNVSPYYTFIGGDVVDVLRQLFHSRGWKRSETLFLNEQQSPISKRNYRTYFYRSALRAGIIKRKTPSCLDCGADTVRKRMSVDGRERIYYLCSNDECGQKRCASDFGRSHQQLGAIRYRVNTHELRDLFRTEYHRAQAYAHADPSCAEFFLGHTIDPLKYDKIMRDRNYAKSQYLKALPWLNVLSEDPRKVDRSDLDAQNEALNRRVQDLERKLMALDSPELHRFLTQLKDG